MYDLSDHCDESVIVTKDVVLGQKAIFQKNKVA
jgi:hypothetical protein